MHGPTPKGGFEMGERPVKPDVLLHCSECRGEFPPSSLRLIWKDRSTNSMVCPGCDTEMRRG